MDDATTSLISYSTYFNCNYKYKSCHLSNFHQNPVNAPFPKLQNYMFYAHVPMSDLSLLDPLQQSSLEVEDTLVGGETGVRGWLGGGGGTGGGGIANASSLRDVLGSGHGGAVVLANSTVVGSSLIGCSGSAGCCRATRGGNCCCCGSCLTTGRSCSSSIFLVPTKLRSGE